MAKKRSIFKKMLWSGLNVIKFSLFFLLNTLIILLPTFAVIAFIQAGTVHLMPSISVPRHYNGRFVHEILPNTRWEHLKPCGTMFDEQEEFNKARQCVNSKVWPETPLPTTDDFVAPRCFIVSTESPDVYGVKEFNFIPIVTPTEKAAIVGVYQPETRTLFVVENVDAAKVYRHELQHFFLHIHDPITEGGGHNQSIWKRCEPPYYTPSERTRIIGNLLVLNLPSMEDIKK